MLLAICGDLQLGSDATEDEARGGAEPTEEAEEGTEQAEAIERRIRDPPEQVAGVPDEFGNVRIDIVDFAFEPEIVEVPVGARVTWVNVGPTDHTAVAFDVDGQEGFGLEHHARGRRLQPFAVAAPGGTSTSAGCTPR